MGYAMGLPDVEVRVLIEGSEVAVAAVFIGRNGHVDVIVGCVEPSEAPRIAMCAELAADAWRAANWKSVDFGPEGTAPFGVSGGAPDTTDGSTTRETGGGDNSIDQFPF